MEGMFPGVLFTPIHSVHLQPAMFNCGLSKGERNCGAVRVLRQVCPFGELRAGSERSRRELVEGRSNDRPCNRIWIDVAACGSTYALMGVPVMHVGIMRVGVDQRLVDVRMGVRFASIPGKIVRMSMVLVM